MKNSRLHLELEQPLQRNGRDSSDVIYGEEDLI